MCSLKSMINLYYALFTFLSKLLILTKSVKGQVLQPVCKNGETPFLQNGDVLNCDRHGMMIDEDCPTGYLCEQIHHYTGCCPSDKPKRPPHHESGSFVITRTQFGLFGDRQLVFDENLVSSPPLAIESIEVEEESIEEEALAPEPTLEPFTVHEEPIFPETAFTVQRSLATSVVADSQVESVESTTIAVTELSQTSQDLNHLLLSSPAPDQSVQTSHGSNLSRSSHISIEITNPEDVLNIEQTLEEQPAGSVESSRVSISNDRTIQTLVYSSSNRSFSFANQSLENIVFTSDDTSDSQRTFSEQHINGGLGVLSEERLGGSVVLTDLSHGANQSLVTVASDFNQSPIVPPLEFGTDDQSQQTTAGINHVLPLEIDKSLLTAHGSDGVQVLEIESIDQSQQNVLNTNVQTNQSSITHVTEFQFPLETQPLEVEPLDESHQISIITTDQTNQSSIVLAEEFETQSPPVVFEVERHGNNFSLQVLSIQIEQSAEATSTTVSIEPNPTTFEPEPTSIEPNPTTFEPEPTSIESNPTTFEPEPTTIKSSPTSIEFNPTSIELSLTIEPNHATIEPDPTTIEPNPIATDRVTVDWNAIPADLLAEFVGAQFGGNLGAAGEGEQGSGEGGLDYGATDVQSTPVSEDLDNTHEISTTTALPTTTARIQFVEETDFEIFRTGEEHSDSVDVVRTNEIEQQRHHSSENSVPVLTEQNSAKSFRGWVSVPPNIPIQSIIFPPERPIIRGLPDDASPPRVYFTSEKKPQSDADGEYVITSFRSISSRFGKRRPVGEADRYGPPDVVQPVNPLDYRGGSIGTVIGSQSTGSGSSSYETRTQTITKTATGGEYSSTVVENSVSSGSTSTGGSGGSGAEYSGATSGASETSVGSSLVGGNSASGKITGSASAVDYSGGSSIAGQTAEYSSAKGQTAGATSAGGRTVGGSSQGDYSSSSTLIGENAKGSFSSSTGLVSGGVSAGGTASASGSDQYSNGGVIAGKSSVGSNGGSTISGGQYSGSATTGVQTTAGSKKGGSVSGSGQYSGGATISGQNIAGGRGGNGGVNGGGSGSGGGNAAGAVPQVTLSCQRFAFKQECERGGRSQYTLRWYLKDGKCCSYPWGHCKGDDVAFENAIRTKAECEQYCVQGNLPAGVTINNSAWQYGIGPSQVLNGNGDILPSNGAAKLIPDSELSCERVNFRKQCDDGRAAQFTLRWFLKDGMCCSYPWGHCKGDDISFETAIRSKQLCEEICLSRGQRRQLTSARLQRRNRLLGLVS